MQRDKWIYGALTVCAASALGLWAVQADEPPKPAGAAPLIVLDSGGKEQKVTAWKYAAGTRRLSWLEPALPNKEEKREGKSAKSHEPSGPEALEFREEDSTLYEDGVLTLIPLDRLRSLDFDNEKDIVTAKVCVGPKEEDDAVLTGPTQYKGINKLVLEAEVDRGDMGVAEVKYLGGIAHGIRGLHFPTPKPPAVVTGGRPAVVTTVYKGKKTTHKVADLQPLYLTAGGEKLSPVLWFRKTLKVEVAGIKKIVVDEAADEPGWQVTSKDGEQTLTPLLKAPIEDQPAVFEGLLGRVPAGYKLFPGHTLSQVQFEAGEGAK